MACLPKSRRWRHGVQASANAIIAFSGTGICVPLCFALMKSESKSSSADSVPSMPGFLTHRPVAEKDIPRICDFPQSEDELFFLFPKAIFPLAASQLRDAIAQRSDATVVELAGEVVAFANFYRWEAGGCCAIGNVVVSPAVRGRGVGRYLVERMIALAFSKHRAAEVTVSCFNRNVAGLLLYPKLGFRPYAVEERKDKQGNRIALVHMRLPRPDSG